MTAGNFPEEGAVVDLSARTKLRLVGSDRFRYLNGQISNDLRKATAANAVHACVLNAKGRINADVFVSVEAESFLLDADADVRESLPTRLERYIIADDVEVQDVTDEFCIFHCIGGGGKLAALEGMAPQVRAVEANRFGLPGVDLWMATDEREAVWQKLVRELPECDAGCAETFRIERGVPRWGAELTEEIIPIEANLEEAAVDYGKGCYIGQEVISRMKMSGQTNKRLCGLFVIDGDAVSGMSLWNAEGKQVGWITGSTESARVGRRIALGYLKRGFQTPGLELAGSREGGSSVRVQVTQLPFA